VEHLPDRLRAVEFEPFRAAIAEQVAFIMTAHVLVPAFDERRPATLSPSIVDALLRRELGFNGVVLSDDLEMKAISARYTVPAAAVEAIRAGCDAVLVCGGSIDKQAETLEALVRAVESGAITATRLDEAWQRLKRAKERFLSGDRRPARERQRTLRAVLGRDEHRAVADEMAAFL
jgi:beta-N-acetylhexosaminidase